MRTVKLLMALFLSLRLFAQASGTLDLSFSQNGIAQYSLDPFTSLYGVHEQPDGKILALGLTDPQNAGYRQLLMRMNPDSTFDTTFGDAGIVHGTKGFAKRSYLLPDGKLLFSHDFMALRYLPNGRIDSTFGDDGMVNMMPTGHSLGFSFIMPLLGDRYLAVLNDNTNHKTTLRRFFDDGMLDPSFSVTIHDFWPADAKLMPDGRFVLYGYDEENGNAVARFLEDGQLDATFGTNGWYLGPPNFGGFIVPQNVALDPNGHVFIIYDESFDTPQVVNFSRVQKLKPDGTPDSAFGSDSKVSFTGGRWAFLLALQPDGKILVGGNIRYAPGLTRPWMKRLLPNGQSDNAFGAGSVVQIPVPDGNIAVFQSISFGATGKIYATVLHYRPGYLTSVGELMRFHNDLHVSSEEPLAKGARLQISPNPAHDFVKIASTDGKLERVALLDLSGKILLEKTGQTAKNGFSIAYLPAGAYWVRAFSEDTILMSKFIVAAN